MSLFYSFETKGDFIGLLLVASAGYDPRMVPQVYEKLGHSTRAQKLNKTEAMEQALSLYNTKA